MNLHENNLFEKFREEQKNSYGWYNFINYY